MYDYEPRDSDVSGGDVLAGWFTAVFVFGLFAMTM